MWNGNLYGMTNVEKFGKYGRYVVVEYNEDAQRMIIDKLLSGEINPEDKEYILPDENEEDTEIDLL
ncbi:MAG: hypothetical protein ACI35W_00295 [Anaeroplasmataceae bacterium]